MVKQEKPTVAIFGGSFDPPHQGHRAIIEEAVHSLDIEKLLVMPAYLNPFKFSSLAPAALRLQWCHTLFDPIEKVVVSSYEIQEGKSIATSQTVKHFKQIYNVKYLIIGADNLTTLSNWHEFEWLNNEITWVIATREGSHLQTQMLKQWKILKINTPVSSSKIRDTKQLEDVDIQIRESVKKILKGQQNMTMEQRIENIVTILDEKKAEEIEVFNLDNADYIAKRVVIANSLNGKHTQALVDQLKNTLKPKGETFLAADISDEWAVIDLGDILIHIMIPEYRQRYSLETFLSELTAAQKKL